MSQQTTIRKLAELVNTPVDTLLEQLANAGMKFSGPDQVVTSAEKVKLLGFLRRSHGKTEEAPSADAGAAKKITLARRKVQEVTVDSNKGGRGKTTVNVEVRQKRSIPRSPGGSAKMTPAEERADILRKLEESRQRNLEEQRMLAEKDRMRDEARERERAEAEAARQRVEDEKRAAQAAAEEAARAPAPVSAPAPAPAASREASPPARAARPSAPAPAAARPASPPAVLPVPMTATVPGAVVVTMPAAASVASCTCRPLTATVAARPAMRPAVVARVPRARLDVVVLTAAAATTATVARTASSARPRRWCVRLPLVKPSPWPTWHRSWP